jgi:CsoR family transcriptional regulator, copper-sensing transcriptional repressor
MDAEARKKVLTRLNRVAGQVAGVQRMIVENRYCVDILHQIAAIRSALDRLGVELLTRHLETCVVGHGEGTEHRRAKGLTRQQLLAEVQTALSQFLK